MKYIKESFIRTMSMTKKEYAEIAKKFFIDFYAFLDDINYDHVTTKINDVNDTYIREYDVLYEVLVNDYFIFKVLYKSGCRIETIKHQTLGYFDYNGELDTEYIDNIMSKNVDTEKYIKKLHEGKINQENVYKFDQDIIKHLEEKGYSYEREVGTGGDELSKDDYAFRYELMNGIAIQLFYWEDDYHFHYLSASISQNGRFIVGMEYNYKPSLLEDILKNNIDTHKYFKKLHEEITYDDILKSDIPYSEKEDKIKKIRLDNIKDYNSKKKSLDTYFYDIDSELNNAAIYNIIKDNEFMKKYVMLLTNRREQLMLQKTIENKEETIEQYNKELAGIEETEEIVNMNKEIDIQQEELNGMKDKLSEYDNLDILLKDWDKYIDETERNLKRGKLVLHTYN